MSVDLAAEAEPAGPYNLPDGSVIDFYRSTSRELLMYVRKQAFVYGIPECRLDAEGVVQEAITRTLENWSRVEQPRAYAFTVAKSLLSAAGRDEAHHDRGLGRAADQVAFLDAGQAGAAPPPAARDPLELVLADEVIRLLEHLTPNQCAATFLRHVEDVPAAEIGTELGCSPATVSVHVHRGLQTLRRVAKIAFAVAAGFIAVVCGLNAWVAEETQTPSSPRRYPWDLVGWSDAAGLDGMTLIMIIIGGLLVALGIGAIILLIVRRNAEDEGWCVPGYRELEELTQAPSGQVVLAEHEASGIRVVIKYLAERLNRDPGFAKAYRAEARILSEIDDQSVARLYEYIESSYGSAVVLEHFEGVSVRVMLREHGLAQPQAALVVLKDSLQGLAAAHRHGVLHRDYNPGKLLINHEGRGKIIYFGIAPRASQPGDHTEALPYVAPELLAGAASSSSADIYAATAVFYECLIGHPHVRCTCGGHEQLSFKGDDFPRSLRELVRFGMEKQPEHRPKDAAVFLVELEAAACEAYGPSWEEEGRAELAQRASLLPPTYGSVAVEPNVPQTPRGYRHAVNMAAAASLAFVLAVAGFFWYQRTAVVNAPSTVVPSESVLLTPSPSVPEGDGG